jgi:hypothetical protein
MRVERISITPGSDKGKTSAFILASRIHQFKRASVTHSLEIEARTIDRRLAEEMPAFATHVNYRSAEPIY